MTAPVPLRVLGRAGSINVRKVLWTGVELGLPLQRLDVDVGSDAFRQLNPNQMMPVLLEGGIGGKDGDGGNGGTVMATPWGEVAFALWESNTICRYLAQREQRLDLLPADPKHRARVEMWMDWQAGELNNSWRYAFMGLVRQSPAHQDAAQQATSVAQWNRHMAMLDAQLDRSGGPWVLGATFTLADVVLGLATHRWRAAPIAHAELPAVQAYYERLCERPGFVQHGRDAGP
ncbi:glutathione S-transferase C-terminal domain-containing protein [Roseateles depolymerans]|uniref:Glutathione S-transferase domain protein n=1 Tax=Roseateles depolymerans TaxID=76731 RepID=A0A0U3MPT3_9BURK|nr:glutathione S-transferase C-terminal domain-containing protein [Roseateles depolymerans]ALV04915.1 Glutathione S-transferase domain protein [Roseateles depolymerans]REG15073.1 glutathione S-transferase [Roseateles depolymerans]